MNVFISHFSQRRAKRNQVELRNQDMGETPLAVQWVRLHASTAGGPGSSLVRELRSRMPQGVAKKKKKT